MAEKAGATVKVGPSRVRAAGLVRLLRDGRRLTLAAQLAEHWSVRTTVKYAPPGTRRVRKRVAYRLSDMDLDDFDDWQDDGDDDRA